MFVIGYVTILPLSLHFNDLSDEGSFNILMLLHSILRDLLTMSFFVIHHRRFLEDHQYHAKDFPTTGSPDSWLG